LVVVEHALQKALELNGSVLSLYFLPVGYEIISVDVLVELIFLFGTCEGESTFRQNVNDNAETENISLLS